MSSSIGWSERSLSKNTCTIYLEFIWSIDNKDNAGSDFQIYHCKIIKVRSFKIAGKHDWFTELLRKFIFTKSVTF